MAIVINGSGTVTGLSAGGLPDNTVDNGTMADDAIGVAELSATGTASSSTFLRGDNAWVAAGGLAECDQWYLGTALNLNTDAVTFVTANQARSTQNGFGLLGTGMSESSGVFTFPSTGFWMVDFNARFHGTAGPRYIHAKIYTTTDNGTWVEAMAVSTNQYDGTSTWYSNAQVKHLFDVTSTTNCKVKFAGFSITASMEMSVGTHFTFTKLGDT